MGVFSRMLNAGTIGLQQGIIAARRVFEDPSTAYQEQTFRNRAVQYQLLWSYYNNSMFEKLPHVFNNWGSWNAGNTWAAYKSNYNLYRNIRTLYNPTRRLVDFYGSQVYPGVLSIDGSALPDGVPLAIPFAKDVDDRLKAAIGQYWQWSNWQAGKSVEVRYGGALGSVLVEIIDDVEHGKVSASIPWPGFLHNLILDNIGNVKSYTIIYQAHDDNESYLYGKQVDQESIQYFRNYEPYDYGNGALIENPYGFVPAVWIKHTDTGGNHGSPAIAGSFAKIDELNSLASHVHDQIHKVIGSPVVMWSSGSIQSLFNKPKRGATNDFEEPTVDQESVMMLKGPADGSVSSLAGNLSLADSLPYMTQLMEEIEADHPELALYKELRGMSQVTGPAAARIVGDVSSRVLEAQAAYDQQNIKLFQMAVAIAGFRANSGAWGPLNRQQKKFTPFNLDSYARGDLDMDIMPRPLLTPTKLERSQEKQAMWTGVGLAVTAGAPLEGVLRDEGWSQEEIDQLGYDKAAAIAKDQTLATEDVIPPAQ